MQQNRSTQFRGVVAESFACEEWILHCDTLLRWGLVAEPGAAVRTWNKGSKCSSFLAVMWAYGQLRSLFLHKLKMRIRNNFVWSFSVCLAVVVKQYCGLWFSFDSNTVQVFKVACPNILYTQIFIQYRAISVWLPVGDICMIVPLSGIMRLFHYNNNTESRSNQKLSTFQATLSSYLWTSISTWVNSIPALRQFPVSNNDPNSAPTGLLRSTSLGAFAYLY